MRRITLLLILAAASTPAFADRWIPYTDGRAGGCWLNNAGHMYGCTPQPQQANQTSNTNSATSIEEQCLRAQHALKDPNRTMNSIRAAERTIEMLRCNK
jgi:hypothetical protein